MNHLFICSIGPVQDFIATARRSRDLWYGSWMLSELAKAAAKTIDMHGGELVFPMPAANTDLDPGSTFNAPNKLVAVLNMPAENLARTVHKAILTRLHQLRDEAFKGLISQRLFDRQLAETQVDDFIEWYWVSFGFDGASGYAQARRVAEALLGARKATRDFVQVNGTHRPKSSLDGARESVINENAYAVPTASDDEKEQRGKALYNIFRARPAERLSGIDLLKRLGERSAERSFASTSHMAALPFLRNVDRSASGGGSTELLRDIADLLSDKEVTGDETDGAVVFSSRLADWIPDRKKRNEIAKDFDTILRRYAGGAQPQPYYALLVADGDNMGAAIDHLTTPHDHRKLSLALSLFAQDVEPIVKSHEGVLVYAGGDDVMAYLPLHTVLNCVHVLADRFSAGMSEFKTVHGTSPTLSTGIVVAHHLEPLADTLYLARQAERTAKTVEGKHGLAIIVSKRSGADRTIQGKRVSVLARLERMIEWRRNGDISAGVAYELQELDRTLGQTAVPVNVLIAEALRVIDRKRETGGNRGIDKEQVKDELERWLIAEDDKVNLQELAYEMIIAAMFAGARDMAEGKLKEDADE